MKRTNIYLDEAQSRLLRHLAIEANRSFTDLVREALDEYLERRGLGDGLKLSKEASFTSDDEWTARVHAVLNRLHAGAPIDLSPDEIEAEITKARGEVRRERDTQHQAEIA
jgi:hypothetical protein